MSERPIHSRRDFLFQLSAGAGAAWLAANWPAILAAQEHAHRAAQAGAAAQFDFFSPEQAAEIEAIAAQMIPTDDTPGAREARVVHFIDRALTTFDKDKQDAYKKGFAEMQAKLKELFPAATRFSAATSEQQVAVLQALEQGEFFGTVRFHSIMGFTSDPSRGGNYNKAGWQVMGFEDRYLWSPPFGYYDAEYLKAQGSKDRK